jgi:hypothetical protein
LSLQTCYNLLGVVFTYAKKLVCPMFEPTRVINPSGWIRVAWFDLALGLETANSGDYHLPIVCVPKSQHLLCASLGVCPSDRESVRAESHLLNAILNYICR